MTTILIPEISLNKIDKNALKDLDILPRQESSWKLNISNINGIIDLFKQIDIIDKTDLPTVMHSSIRVCDNEDDIFDNLTDYSARFLKNSLAEFGLESTDNDPVPLLLNLNLMPFFIGPANCDRFIAGLCQELSNKPQLSHTTLILLVTQHALFSRSQELKSFIQSESGLNLAIIIDLDGNGRIIKKDKENSEPKVQTIEITRSIFERILHFPTKKSFRNSLIYQTNINIGHFELGSCHVRTHYDLKNFIKRDNVFEHIYNEFSLFVDSYNKISIIGTGLEVQALAILGNKLQATNTDDQEKIHVSKKLKRRVDWRGHIEFENFEKNIDLLHEVISESECILILTDVVNSGSTINKAATVLAELISQKYSETEKPKILIYSLVKMNNSKGDFKAAVAINRPYLKSDPDLCPLCQLKQPLKKVNPENWEEDFRYVDNAQLTPLDFWEIVYDCEALKRNKPYLPGGNLLHRIDTEKLIEKYEHFLINVTRNKYFNHWGDKLPDVIVTVNEDPGKKFSKLVIKSLKNPLMKSLYIPRSVLNEVSSPSEKLDNYLEVYSKKNLSFLIVDDGINRSSTLVKMIALLKRYNANITGALVLDSRLQKEKIVEIEKEIQNFHIATLYTWPSKPIYYANVDRIQT